MATSQSEIPVLKLISEVGKRPVLYLKSDDVFGKASAWCDVFRELYPDWETFRATEMSVKLQDLQSSWKRLKYTYNMNKIKMSKLHGKYNLMPHEYLYYENLKFLDEVPKKNLCSTNEERLIIRGQNEEGECSTSSSNEITFMDVEVLEIEKPDPVIEKSHVEDEMKEICEDEYFMMSAMDCLNKFTTDEKIDIKIEIFRMIQNKLREKDQQTSLI